MNNALITVIIPTYNCGKYIEEAIDSVISQDYEPVEIIVINDGSTDDTGQLLTPYEDQITYVNQENRGSSKARNVGLTMAKGEYVAFLDSDDRWLPNKLTIQVKVLNKISDVGLVFTNFSAIGTEGDKIRERYVMDTFFVFKEYGLTFESIFGHRKDIPIINGERETDTLGIYYGNVFFDLMKGNFILPSTTLFRKDFIDNIGLRWNEEYKCAQDQDFHLRFAKHYPVAYIDVDTTEYRIEREGKLSGNRNTPLLIENTLHTLNELVEGNAEHFRSKATLVNEVFGKTYSRLAYYFLTEHRKVEARKYALQSLKTTPINFRALMVFMLSFIPEFLLRALGRVKRTFTQHT